MKAKSLLLLSIFIFLSCASFTKYGKLQSSALKHYQNKRYDNAFRDCVQSLRLKPDYGKSQLLMKDVYRSGIEFHKSNITTALNSTDKFKYDTIVEEYNTMISMNNEIKSLPTLIDKKTKTEITFDVEDYNDELLDAKNLAAEAHYQEGDRLAKNNSLDSQKEAAKEFKQANSFISGYKDASQRYAICRKAGIKRMAIIPFENKSGKTQYGAIEDMITDQIISEVMGDRGAMEFLEIISRDQMSQVMAEQELGMSGVINDQTAIEIGKVLGVHELLVGKITQIAYTPPRTVNNTYKDTKSVIVGEETYYDDKGNKRKRAKWGDVTANITKYKKTADASINGSYSIIDVATAKIKKNESFKGKYSYLYEWGKFRGDERALSSSSKSLCGKSEAFPPNPEEMVNMASTNLSHNLAITLCEYAK